MTNATMGWPIEALQTVLKNQHGFDAVCRESHRVIVMLQGQPVWKGDVYVFEAAAAKAPRYYGWTTPGRVTGQDELVIAIADPMVDSPEAAVRAWHARRRREPER